MKWTEKSMTHDLIMVQILEDLLNDKGKNNTTVENKTNIPFLRLYPDHLLMDSSSIFFQTP